MQAIASSAFLKPWLIFRKAALVHTNPQNQRQCKQAIINSAFLAALTDLEKATLTQVESQNQKFNASKPLPIQHF